MKKLGGAFAVLTLLAGGCGQVSVAGDGAGAQQVTVYEFGEVGKHLRLFPVQAAVSGSGDAAEAAVSALIRHEPSRRGRENLWRGICAPAAAVESVDVGGRLLTVHLEEFAPDEAPGTCDMTAEGWTVQVQQLVWTATTATGSDVRVRAVFDDDRVWRPAARADPDLLAGPLDQSHADVGPRGVLPDPGASSCVEEYSPRAVSRRAFAFDGVVVALGAARSNRPGGGDVDLVAVTFAVHEWFHGGTGALVTLDMTPPTDMRETAEWGPASYGIGTRMLVSGEPRWDGPAREDAIAWTCGFTRYHRSDTAADWREAAR